MSTVRTVFFVFGVAFAAFAQAQIPVTDAGNLQQNIQQVLSWSNQLKAMADQVQNLEQQLQSMTGNRGFGNMLNDPNLQQYFKNNLPNAQALRQQYGGGNPCQGITDQQALQYCQQVANMPFQNYEQINQAIAISDQRARQVQGLMLQINQTSDPKSIAELQARIASEQAAMQNEMVRMQLTLQNMEIQNKLAKEQQSQAASARTKAEIEGAKSKTAAEILRKHGM